ncbi:Hsp70 family protein [Mycolicibacterium mucogenicum]|uniref:Hsp70 family protein n=1 Tax=Mycolicibacterium mucogenicum DSM 44124 TaxID=1226753 RepID=A0A8H2PF07_MYCMU|nr:Hsp70 family protein [Mycolicibacterium mucogenicum]KAB7758893.1 molecular chaperone [Mycolicibacterium mucogenicum DSM 44124]QPG69786.1 Hsp70 family protein [Mycolicibacterium mucogenicum DSM 44124]
MSHQLGLSIGTTNLVAARVGEPPMVRRAVLRLFRDRAPQIGLSADAVDDGVTLSGFVERVGDPVPMVAPDGTAYHADQLVAEALDALIEAAGGEPPTGQLAISVPAHWDTATLRAMRTVMRSNPSLAPNGVPARLVSDAVAALTALHANPGLPATGTAALLDFGGGGTSITLAAADTSFEPIETVRYPEFSGEGVDQALLSHVLDRVGGAGGVDTAGTAAVSSLEKLRESCCAAKELLSEAETATVPVDIPGHQGDVEVTRAELSELLDEPLTGVLAELDELLQRNNIAWRSVSSVVAVGGGARIPMVSTRLAAHLEARGGAGILVTTPQPALDAAVGAALFAVYGADADAKTGMAPAALLGTAPTAAVDGGSATAPAAIPELDVLTDTAAARVVKATGPSLAWSEDSDGGGDLLPYTGDDVFGDTTTTRAIAQYVPPAGAVATEPSKAWQRLPLVVFGVAIFAAIAAVGGVTIALTGDRKPVAPPTTPPPSLSESPTPPPPAPPAEPPPPSTVTVTNEVPAPPPPQPSPTYQPPVTHTPAPTHTTTTHAPTTTPPPVTTTATTTEAPPPPPPPSTTETPTSTTPTMTTSYIRLPFVPVPIPIQVPKGPDQPAESQPPTNPYYPGQQQYPYGQYPQQYPQQYPY